MHDWQFITFECLKYVILNKLCCIFNCFGFYIIIGLLRKRESPSRRQNQKYKEYYRDFNISRKLNTQQNFAFQLNGDHLSSNGPDENIIKNNIIQPQEPKFQTPKASKLRNKRATPSTRNKILKNIAICTSSFPSNNKRTFKVKQYSTKNR